MRHYWEEFDYPKIYCPRSLHSFWKLTNVPAGLIKTFYRNVIASPNFLTIDVQALYDIIAVKYQKLESNIKLFLEAFI